MLFFEKLNSALSQFSRNGAKVSMFLAGRQADEDRDENESKLVVATCRFDKPLFIYTFCIYLFYFNSNYTTKWLVIIMNRSLFAMNWWMKFVFGFDKLNQIFDGGLGISLMLAAWKYWFICMYVLCIWLAVLCLDVVREYVRKLNIFSTVCAWVELNMRW